MNPTRELAEVLSSVKNSDELYQAMEEILTPSELKDLGLRWELMKRLWRKIPQREIASELHISLCKITRGSKLLKKEDGMMKQLVGNFLRETL